jgi:hypothetical protein
LALESWRLLEQRGDKRAVMERAEQRTELSQAARVMRRLLGAQLLIQHKYHLAPHAEHEQRHHERRHVELLSDVEDWILKGHMPMIPYSRI